MAKQSRSKNLILRSLPPDDYARIERELGTTDLPVRKVLHRDGEPITTIYFPLGGVCLLSHEFLAVMLGVRRPTATIAAGILQKAGLITYRRGRMTVLNREGLEEAACECYVAVQEHFDRLLPGFHPAD